MGEGRSVLVVDDEPGIRGLLASILRREGFHVHTAADAGEALDIFRSVGPDVVLADVVMPGTDGVALLEQLLEIDRRVPVLLMTAFGELEAAVDAMRRGALDYITKPFKRQRVVESLRRALEAREGRDAPAQPRLEGSVVESGLAERMTLREVADLYIERVLTLTRGNKVQAARALGINRRTLYRRARLNRDN
jgi:DNA-binding NtrC family response regulator